MVFLVSLAPDVTFLPPITFENIPGPLAPLEDHISIHELVSVLEDVPDSMPHNKRTFFKSNLPKLFNQLVFPVSKPERALAEVRSYRPIFLTSCVKKKKKFDCILKRRPKWFSKKNHLLPQ